MTQEEAKIAAWQRFIKDHAWKEYDIYENPNIEFSFAFDAGYAAGKLDTFYQLKSREEAGEKTGCLI